MPEDFRFRPEHRLRKRSQFLCLYQQADRFHTPFFVLYIRENSLQYSRLGITVSRKIGKPAVRNRIKRRLREIFRQEWKGLQPAVDIVVNAKRQAAGSAFHELRDNFAAAIRRWKRGREEK